MQSLEVKKGTLYNIADCLTSLVKATDNMSGKLHYILDRNMKVIEAKINLVEESRSKLIMDYCVKDENNTPILADDEEGKKVYQFNNDDDKKEVLDKTNVLLNEDINIDVYKIPLSLYEDCRLDPKKLLFHNILFDIYIEENL